MDPKGFLFDEVLLPHGESLTPSQEYARMSEILKSNWTLYKAQDIISLDWALGRLNHYLTAKIN